MIACRAVSLFVVASVFVACASAPPPASPTEVDTSPLPTAPAPLPVVTSGAEGSFTCPWAKPDEGGTAATVTYDKSCKRNEDCGWAQEPVCCGQSPTIGVRKGEEKKITSTCGPCPAVACAVGGMRTEDGSTSGMVLVNCIDEKCVTSVAKRG